MCSLLSLRALLRFAWLRKTALSSFAREARFTRMDPLKSKLASVLYEKSLKIKSSQKNPNLNFVLKIRVIFGEIEHDFSGGLS